MRERIFTFIVKTLYLIPAMIYCAFFGYVGLRLGFDGFPTLALVYAVLFIAATVLLWKNYWLGCVLGMAVGGIIIYLFETSHIHHHLNESHIGICIIAYYAVAGLLCYKIQRGK